MEQEVKVITVKIGDEDRKVQIRKPTPKVDGEGNLAYSKVFSKLIKERDSDGKPVYILRDQLNAYLNQIGIYSDQDIDDINTFGDRIKELEELLSSGGKKKSEGKKAAIELRTLRYAIYTLLMKQAMYDRNTVEHYADNARMDYLITKCLTFEGGAPIFKNVADYESDSFLQSALKEPIKLLASMVSEYDPDFEKNLPENQFLKKYGFCDDDYRLINKEGQFVDADGNLLDNEGNKLIKEIRKEAVGEFLEDEEDLVVAKEEDPVVTNEEEPAVTTTVNE